MKPIEYKFLQYPRGANKGGTLDVDICPTISCSNWEYNCVLIKIYGQETDDPTPKSGGANQGRLYD